MATDLYLSDKQYLTMLEKLQTLIREGLKLELDGSDDIGNKHTHASWGQCTEKNWDKDALFREDKPFLGSKQHAKGQFCPFDTKVPTEGNKLRNNPSGCFYRCRLFQAKKGEMPNREKALELYHVRIHEAKNMINFKSLVESTCAAFAKALNTKEEAMHYVDDIAYTISLETGVKDLVQIKQKVRDFFDGITW